MKFSLISSVLHDRRGAIGSVAIIIGMVIIGLGILVGNQLQDPSKRINILPRAAIETFPIEAFWTNEGTTDTIDDRVDVIITIPCDPNSADQAASRNLIEVYDSSNNNTKIGLMINYSLPVPTGAGTKGSWYCGKWPDQNATLKAYYRFYGTKEQLRAKGLPKYVKFKLPSQTDFSNEVDLGGAEPTPTPCLPNLTAPANNANVPSNPTFRWSACSGTGVKYRLEAKQGNTLVDSVITTATSYTFASPKWQSGVRYTWTVKTCPNPDCVGGTPTAAVAFTYLPATPTPSIFPATTISCTVSGNNATWTWGTVTGAADYYLDIKGNDNSSYSEGWVGVSTRSKTITGKPGVTYTGKVMGTSVQRQNGTYATASCKIPEVQKGSIKVALNASPSNYSGHPNMKWRRVNTTTWFSSGTIESNVPAGTYQIEFQAVAGFNAPAKLTGVTVSSGQTTTKTATYQLKMGGIKINIPTPRPNGAQWRRVAIPEVIWRNSGTTEPSIPSGQVSIEFKPVTGYVKPANFIVAVPDGGVIEQTSGAYVPVATNTPTPTKTPTPTPCLPNLTAPANNANVPSNPTFRWSACSGTGVKYRLEAKQGNTLVDSVITTATSYTFASPKWQSGVRYTWTVKTCPNPDCVGGTPTAAVAFTYLPATPTPTRTPTSTITLTPTKTPTPTNIPMPQLACSVVNNNVRWTITPNSGINLYWWQVHVVNGRWLYNNWRDGNFYETPASSNTRYLARVNAYDGKRQSGFTNYVECATPVWTPTPTLTGTPTKTPTPTLIITATNTPIPTSTAPTMPPFCTRFAQGDATCNDIIDNNDLDCWAYEYVFKKQLAEAFSNGQKCEKSADFDSQNGVGLLDFAIWRLNRVRTGDK